jgi:serine/threonine protein kinase
VVAAFNEALEIRAGLDREALLLRMLSDAPELIREVREMLRAHETGAALAIEKRLLNEALNDEASEDPLLGSSIGIYRLVRLLGSGGMGEVYLAERQENHFRHEVALKLLRAWGRGPDMLARFRLERQILARLNHPSIVPLLDGGFTSDGRPYLVLQYVRGETLMQYCESRQLPIEARLKLFCEVARALEYAHRNLVVHRDLKPANILVTAEGHVRLLDFGIAKLLDLSDDLDAPITRTDSRIMTLDYAAPEQILGTAITTATDVHALGALLYELLTGRRPFAAADGKKLELEKRIVEEQPVAPSRAAHTAGLRIAKSLLGDLDTIVLKALEKEPERRYPSVEEMARDVERYLAGEPVQVRRPSTTYRLGKFVRRNRIASSLAAICFLLFVGLVITASVQSRRVVRERDAARAEQQKTEKVVAMLVELFSASNPLNTPQGKDITVGEFLKGTEWMTTHGDILDAGVQIRLKHLLGQAQMARGQYEEARKLLEDAQRQSRSLDANDNPASAAILFDLARLSRESEPRTKSLPLLRQSLERLRQVFGDNDERVASCLNELGWALLPSEESKSLFEQSVAIRRSLSPAPTRELAASLASLAAYYTEAQNFSEAEKYYAEALRIFKEVLPEGHPATLDAMGDVATMYQRQGRLDEAAALHRSIIDLKSRLIGPETDPVAMGYANLALVFVRQGRYKEAEEALRRGLEIHMKLFGPEHLQVVNETRNLGRLREVQEDHAGAEILIGRALAVLRRLGGDEQSLRYMEGQFAMVRMRLGHAAEALRTLRMVYGRLKSLSPKGSPMVADSSLWLGFALLEAEPASGAREAETLFWEAVDFQRSTLPADHPKVAEAECALAQALAALGRRRDAETLLAKALPILSAAGGFDRYRVRQFEMQLAELRRTAQ